MLAALLTACTGQPAAEPTPTRTASPSPSRTAEPTPTPTAASAPERPAAMDDPGSAGADATANYFIDLFEYVVNGDVTAWQALSHPECVFCKSVSDEVGHMAAERHRQEGPNISVTSTDVTEITPGSFYGVDLRVTQGPHRELNASGAVVTESNETTKLLIHLVIVREAGSWIVREAEVKPDAG